MMNESKKIVALLYNAICFMYENNMSKKEIADYLGTDNETLDAIMGFVEDEGYDLED